MKSNKGFTLLELLICVTLVSVVVVFLFKLINDVQNEKKNAPYISEVYATRNEIMNKTNKIISKYGVCSSNTSQSTDEQAIINLSICNGKSMVITVTSVSFMLEYDGSKEIYRFEDDGIWIEPVFDEQNDIYQNYEYYSILFKVHKKGHEDTLLDDIGIFYGIVRDDDTAVITTSLDCNFENDEGCELVIPKTGTYRIEAWGGKGDDNHWEDLTIEGGKGGYVYGEIELEAGTVLYAGLSLGAHTDDPDHHGYTADGGKGPFIAYKKIGTGWLYDYENDQSLIIMAAGAGGGGSNCWHDANNLDWYATARGKDGHGTRWVGGFGKANGCSSAFWCGGMGGGGYYGGASPQESFYSCDYGKNRQGGYGGSSYINTNVLQNAAMYTSASDRVNSSITGRTILTTCSGYAKSGCMNLGGPYVRLSIPTET